MASDQQCPIKVVRTSTRTLEGNRRIFYVLQVADGALVNRQYEEFRDFEKAWKAIYPTLEDVSLGSMVTDALSLFKPEDKRKEQRKQQLADYLAKIWQVAALRPMLAEFLEVDKAKLGLEMPSGSANSVVSPAAALDSKQGNAAKGNTMAASRAAQRDKERFLEQHAHVLDKLMPDHDRRFANLASAKTKGKSIFRAGGGAGQPVVIQERDTYPQATVLCAWEADPGADEATEFLSIREGEVLSVIDKTPDEDWWFGENSAGVGGYFPATYADTHPSHVWYVPVKAPPMVAMANKKKKKQQQATTRPPPQQQQGDDRPPAVPPKPKPKPKTFASRHAAGPSRGGAAATKSPPPKKQSAPADAKPSTSVAELRKRFQQ